MLFKQRFWAGMADGTVTVTFRTWKKPQAIAGRRYRSPAGMLEVDAVDLVDVDSITDDDAVAAGYADRAQLVADLYDSTARSVYRIRFHHAGEDPRVELRGQADLSAEELAGLRTRLDRLDRASKHGPWTAETLRLIAARPAVRAGDLADQLGRERAPFKLDVRKLKALGLTESLEVGYRISPRGAAYLAAEDAGRA